MINQRRYTRSLRPPFCSFMLAATFHPSLPEDIERAITEVLLHDARDMAGTMSLVASRFNAWTKPLTFHTVTVRRDDNWMQTVSDCVLPNAIFIRILVLDLPFTQDQVQLQSSAEELSIIRRLLEACGRVSHLAVTWNIWAHLERECGVLELKSLCLVWDGEFSRRIDAPSFLYIRHPAALQDLTVSAPANLENPTPLRSRGQLDLPVWTQAWKNFLSLSYVTYASNVMPSRGILRGCNIVFEGEDSITAFKMRPIDFQHPLLRNIITHLGLTLNDTACNTSRGSRILPGCAGEIIGMWRLAHHIPNPTIEIQSI
ncbi:hypothetical protein B0H19DRAFT_1374632 [Mycena capillaripes]|nr:hypothetical protein B0H19DRAFT_1374632 [Mycena capillaripes]